MGVVTCFYKHSSKTVTGCAVLCEHSTQKRCTGCTGKSASRCCHINVLTKKGWQGDFLSPSLPLIPVRGSLLQFHFSLWEATKDKYSFRCRETWIINALSHIAPLCCLHHMIELKGGGDHNASAAMCSGCLMLVVSYASRRPRSLCVVKNAFLTQQVTTFGLLTIYVFGFVVFTLHHWKSCQWKMSLNVTHD